MPRPPFAIAALPLALLSALPLAVRADSGSSLASPSGNAFGMRSDSAGPLRDERGTSWLRPGQRRSPSANLYVCPLEPPSWQRIGEWEFDGRMQLGYLASSGDEDNALWNRYVRWDSGLILGLIELALRRPEDASYASLRASRISSDDAFLEATFGRAGSFKVQALLRELPNTLSDDARPIWSGVGSNRLILLPQLAPGTSSSAAVAAAAAGVAPQRLQLTRRKSGLGVDAYLSPQWTVHARLSEEQRTGARPFGGAFFYNFLFPGNAGVLETVRPVDDSTINLDGGLRYAGQQWRLEFAYTASFYRGRYRRFLFESPFALAPALADATSASVYQGQFALEPDNDYHQLRGSLTRRLRWNGELNLSVAAGRMSQDDGLIAPIGCSGHFGIDTDGSGLPGPGNPFLHACADWNTPAALSRSSADLRIGTYAVDSRLTLQPGERLGLRAAVNFRREDYRNTYLAYNPLTGDYGYLTENGAQASILPGALGIWNPLTAASVVTRVRSLPFDQETSGAQVGADWRLSERRSLGLTLATQHKEPRYRERRRVVEDSVKLAYVDRSLERLTLRASYTGLDRHGSAYVANPYDFAYSVSLPGFVAPPGGVPAFTVDAMRKYDLADRRAHKLDLSATVALSADMTLAAGLHGDWNDYAATIGRQAQDRQGFNLQWEWQPSPLARASAYYGIEQARLRMANVADVVFGPDGSLGGPDYPLDARWWAYDKQRNRNAGATLDRRFGPLRVDASWHRIAARGLTGYRFDSPNALAYFADGLDGARSGSFPLMRYRVDSLILGLGFALSPRTSLRVFDYYERGRIDDWHYLGLDQGRVIDHRVYSDGGLRGYTSNLVGLLLDIRL